MVDFPERLLRWKRPIYVAGAIAVAGIGVFGYNKMEDYMHPPEPRFSPVELEYFNDFGKYVLSDVERLGKALKYGGIATLIGGGIGLAVRKKRTYCERPGHETH